MEKFKTKNNNCILYILFTDSGAVGMQIELVILQLMIHNYDLLVLKEMTA